MNTLTPEHYMLPCQKHQFSLPDGLHYLNCAYMSPNSRRVEAAGMEGIRRKNNPALIRPESFFDEADTARRLFARLVNASDARRIAVIPSVSYGIATVARNTPVSRGQNIIVAHEQFPSNVYAWRRVCQEQGAELRAVVPPDTYERRGEQWNERILEAIDRNTALVALGHVHWADGTRFDLERIGQRAREVGAALIVDGTQSVGALPFDVEKVQPDALVVASYKWLMGPYSLGLAYYGARYDGGIPLEESWMTRKGAEDFSNLVPYQDEYQPGALRYDVGERSNFALMPMLIAALEQLLEWGIPNIQDYCRRLMSDLRNEARELGYMVEDEHWSGAHLFGLRVPAHVSMEHLSCALSERNVSVSIRGDAVRIAPNVYNDVEDANALREALYTCATPERQAEHLGV